jgi:cyclopropane-fatty-acyl-phospholipid synthase
VTQAVTEAPGYAGEGAGPASIAYHYDVSNEFFFLWLGPTKVYSSALFAPGDDLDRAQIRKLDHHAEQARVEGASRVLDIGCGWGSMLQRLVDHHHVGHATGITLSEQQVAHIADWGDPRIEARVEDWIDHTPKAPYDAIISIGAIEHFVRLGADRETRMEVFTRFFESCRDWLVPGGRLSLQCITKGDADLDRQGRRDLRFIVTEVFPNIDAPWLAELTAASERRFEMVALRNDRLDYARTLVEWSRRLRANRERAVELVGEDVVARHEQFFPGSARHFALRQANLLRMTFAAV